MISANIIESKKTTVEGVNKVPNLGTAELTFDTYYFEPGQVLNYHRHPTGDQIFVILEGEGKFYLDDGKEEILSLKPGVVVLAPKNIWHKVINTGKTVLIASQATKQPAGMEART